MTAEEVPYLIPLYQLECIYSHCTITLCSEMKNLFYKFIYPFALRCFILLIIFVTSYTAFHYVLFVFQVGAICIVHRIQDTGTCIYFLHYFLILFIKFLIFPSISSPRSWCFQNISHNESENTFLRGKHKFKLYVCNYSYQSLYELNYIYWTQKAPNIY